MSFDVSTFYDEIDRIQDAALEQGLWKPLIENISQACGALGVNIMQPVGPSGFDGVLYTDSLGEAMESYIDEGWHLRDHRSKFTRLAQRRGVILEEDFATEEQFRSLEYYRFLSNHGLRYTAVVNFSAGDDHFYFVLQRRLEDGPFHPDHIPHFRALRSRLQASLKITALFSQSNMTGRLSAFERANVACVFFDHLGHVVASNSKADELLRGDVRISNRKIRASRTQEAALFEATLRRTLDSTVPLPTDQMVVPFTRLGARPLLARIEKVGANIRDLFDRSCAMALFEDLDEPVATSAGVLKRLFGLTPMECTITSLLIAGMDTQEAAKSCNIGYETARTHIRSILRKTRTERQAELCSLLGRIRFG